MGRAIQWYIFIASKYYPLHSQLAGRIWRTSYEI